MKKILASMFAVLAILFLVACDDTTSDDVQRQQQEKILAEGTAQTGMPAIKNFRERKLLKDVLEMRDQTGLVTYTYLQAEMSGELCYLGTTVGYPLPYSTQYTNPQKLEWRSQRGYYPLPQADPNGLFSPGSAEGTWVLMKNPHGDDTKPIYVEPRVLSFPWYVEAKPCAAGLARK